MPLGSIFKSFAVLAALVRWRSVFFAPILFTAFITSVVVVSLFLCTLACSCITLTPAGWMKSRFFHYLYPSHLLLCRLFTIFFRSIILLLHWLIGIFILFFRFFFIFVVNFCLFGWLFLCFFYWSFRFSCSSSITLSFSNNFSITLWMGLKIFFTIIPNSLLEELDLVFRYHVGLKLFLWVFSIFIEHLW